MPYRDQRAFADSEQRFAGEWKLSLTLTAQSVFSLYGAGTAIATSVFAKAAEISKASWFLFLSDGENFANPRRWLLMRAARIRTR
jgi:hypothetical protein